MRFQDTNLDVVEVPAYILDVDGSPEGYPASPEPAALRLRVGDGSAQEAAVPTAHLRSKNTDGARHEPHRQCTTYMNTTLKNLAI